MENLTQIEAIETYLEGKLSGEELRLFEKKMAEDAAFKREVLLQQQAVRLVVSGGNLLLKKELSNIHQEVFGEAAQRKARNQNLAAAASVVVGVGLLAWWLWPSGKAVEQKNILLTDSVPAKKEMPVTTPPPATDTVTENSLVPPAEVLPPAPAEKKTKPAATHRKTAKLRKPEIIKNNQQYKFHYRFHEGQLALFGAFDRSQAEFQYDRNGQPYLVYENKTYPIKETGTGIKPLVPSADSSQAQQIAANTQSSENVHIDKGFLGTTSQLDERFINKKTETRGAAKPLRLAAGVTEITLQTLLNDRDPDHSFHYQFDDLFLTLYGPFANVPKQVVKTPANEFFLILPQTGDVYELEKDGDRIKPLKKLKRKQLKKVLFVPDEEEL
jgi:hypothetical protein